MAKATFGAGCFWGIEARLRKIKGVRGRGSTPGGARTPNILIRSQV